MTILIHELRHHGIAHAAKAISLDIKYRLDHYRRAWAYARGRLTPEQAQLMICEVESDAGWYSLNTLCAEAVLNDALERWEPHPELGELVDEACWNVSKEYEDCTEVNAECRSWALEKVAEFAQERGIILRAS